MACMAVAFFFFAGRSAAAAIADRRPARFAWRRTPGRQHGTLRLPQDNIFTQGSYPVLNATVVRELAKRVPDPLVKMRVENNCCVVKYIPW